MLRNARAAPSGPFLKAGVVSTVNLKLASTVQLQCWHAAGGKRQREAPAIQLMLQARMQAVA